MNLSAATAYAREWRDNLLDATTLRQYYGGVANGNNAYRSCARQLTPAGSGNLTLTALSYASDTWKRRWYATATPTLVNAGSRSAGVVSPPPPSLTLRFVQFSQPAANGWGCFSQTDWYAFTAQDVRDCQFLNAWNQFWGPWAVANTIEVRNNLFQRSPASFVGCQTLDLYNNLFWGGSNYFKSHQVGFWTIRDNAFHDTVLRDDSAAGWVSNGHNAYLGAGQAQLQNSSGNDVVTTTFAYATGPYGPWYQASTSLVDRGSRSAADAGLYHHTIQADQAKEAATQVDIGFHYVAVDACGQPVDADGDGVADYAEDTNGNGAVDSGETDPNNPVSDPVSGLLDGVKSAPVPEIIQYSYRLDAARDYDTIPRNGNTPDASVHMRWWGKWPGWRDSSGDYHECYDGAIPNGALVLAGEECRWQQYLSLGTKAKWEVRQGGPSKTYTGTTYIGWPPSAEIKVPNEVCTGLLLHEFPNKTVPPLTYTRGAYTTSHLKANALHWPKKTRSVVVSCQAYDKSDGATLDPTADGYDLGEPVEAPGGEWLDPWLAGIEIAGKRVNALGEVMLQVDLDKPDPTVTPQIAGPVWYSYEPAISLPHLVTLTWSKHPSAPDPPDLQSQFDAGAMLLAEDNDGPGSHDDSDDVSCYLEFFIIKARHPEFPEEYTERKFNHIDNWGDLLDLYTGSVPSFQFANIKLVSEMQVGGIPFIGYAEGGSSMILVSDECSPTLVMHECGHNAWLGHRGWEGEGNPGDPLDASAIMYSPDPTSSEDPPVGDGNEINEYESGFFMNWSPDLWNQEARP